MMALQAVQEASTTSARTTLGSSAAEVKSSSRLVAAAGTAVGVGAVQQGVGTEVSQQLDFLPAAIA